MKESHEDTLQKLKATEEYAEKLADLLAKSEARFCSVSELLDKAQTREASRMERQEQEIQERLEAAKSEFCN